MPPLRSHTVFGGLPLDGRASGSQAGARGRNGGPPAPPGRVSVLCGARPGAAAPVRRGTARPGTCGERALWGARQIWYAPARDSRRGAPAAAASRRRWGRWRGGGAFGGNPVTAGTVKPRGTGGRACVHAWSACLPLARPGPRRGAPGRRQALRRCRRTGQRARGRRAVPPAWRAAGARAAMLGARARGAVRSQRHAVRGRPRAGRRQGAAKRFRTPGAAVYAVHVLVKGSRTLARTPARKFVKGRPRPEALVKCSGPRPDL